MIKKTHFEKNRFKKRTQKWDMLTGKIFSRKNLAIFKHANHVYVVLDRKHFSACDVYQHFLNC